MRRDRAIHILGSSGRQMGRLVCVEHAGEEGTGGAKFECSVQTPFRPNGGLNEVDVRSLHLACNEDWQKIFTRGVKSRHCAE